MAETEERRGGRRRSDDERPKLDLKVKIDVISEIAMMRSCCKDERVRKKYAPIVPPDYFLGPGHADIWGGVVELNRRGLDYSRDVMQGIIGEELAATLDGYVSRAGAEVESDRNLVQHVASLKWDKARADVAGVLLPEFYEALRDPTTDPANLQLLADKVAKALRVRDLRHLRGVDSVMTEMERELRGRLEGTSIVRLGIHDLDFYGPDDYVVRNGVSVCLGMDENGNRDNPYPRIVPGMAPGMNTVITGESGSGKTVLTANVIIGLVMQEKRVLWGAWEQRPKYSLELITEIMTGISRGDMWAGMFGEEEIEELKYRGKHLRDFLMFFDSPFGRDAIKTKYRGEMNERNLNTVHEYVSTSGCNVAILDVFRDALEESRPEDEIRALKRIQGIAIETNSHIAMVQHINIKQAEGGKPKRGNVMGTGDWINKADNAFAVWADREKHKLEVHILKQRHGRWPLAVELDCDFEFSRIGKGRSIVVKDDGERSEMDEFLGGSSTDRAPSQRRKRRT